MDRNFYKNMNFKNFLPHLIALVVFIVAVFAAFSPAFSGKTIRQGDSISGSATAQEAIEYREATGDRALWTNSQFGGMPTYQIRKISDGNTLKYVDKLANGLGLPYPAGIFFSAMLCMYIFLVLMGVSPWLSIVGALAFSLVSNNFILYETGHNTKIRTVAYFPLIMAGLVLAWRKKYLLGGLVFAIGLALSLLNNHPQLLYYFLLTVPIFGIGMIIHSARTSDWVHFGKTMGVLVAGFLLALGSAASNALPTLEYGEQTMRGAPILKSEAPANVAPTSSSETDGLEWTYAMNWSNNFEDIMATVIPRAAGGGYGEEIDRDTPFGKTLSRMGSRIPETFQAPTYHGGQPFTSGPRYLGAVVWFLFVLGLLTVRGPVKWWLVGGTIFGLLLSMGSYAEWLNRFMYNYLPLFNKFRAPSSVITSIGLLVSALGLLGIHEFTKLVKADAEAAKKKFFIAAGVSLGTMLLMILIGPSLFDLTSPTDLPRIQQMVGQAGDQNTINALVTALEETRAEIFRGDAIRSFLFMALAAGAVFLFSRSTYSVAIMAGILAVLVVVDFSGVSGRYVTADDYSPKRKVEQSYTASPADQQILQDPDPHYRVYNTTARDPFQDGLTSYHHKSVGGYHPAKLQRYDDLISRHLKAGNQAVFNMMNAKYYIVDAGQGPQAQRNPNALGNAWLVSNIQMVDDANAEINGLGGQFDPAETAIVHREFADQVSGLQPNGQGSISLTSYSPMELKYNFNSNAEQLAVFSEVWYGPDTGWEATIDGNPAEIIRTNYVLRALRVPAGQHEIVMSFNPSSYATGYILSLICSLLLIGGIVYVGFRYYQSSKAESEQLATATVLDEPATKQGKTKAKRKKKG
ncbi:hypothetical protein CEQ90_00805 [Lewinellaceae bacterium SD302]|nr:hypothetical protein CEQ90_00805 [Lewinellaceae bacterium SD302]